MKKLAHPHVLRLFEVMDDPRVNKLYLVLEHMQGGDLMRFLRQCRRQRPVASGEPSIWVTFCGDIRYRMALTPRVQAALSKRHSLT